MPLLDDRARRILTTHVGSLPRPNALSEMMADGHTGTSVYARAVSDGWQKQSVFNAKPASTLWTMASSRSPAS